MTELRQKINNIVEEKNTKVVPENIRAGRTIFDVEGIFSSDATATASDILKDKTAYVNGEKIVGTLKQSSDSSNYNATLSNDNNEPMTVKGWITEVSSVDLTGVTSMKNAFDGCSTLKKIGNLLNTGDVTDTSYCFRYCYYLEVVPTFDTSNVTITTSMFNACTMLENVPLLDMSSVTRVSSMFDSCPSLKNLDGFKNLGKSYNQQSSGHQYLTLDLDVASGLTHESLMNVINNLYDLNLTYDVANGGTLYTQKLQIGATNLAKLTPEEIRNSDSKAVGQ